MQCTGDSSGNSNNASVSTISKADAVEQESIAVSEVSSCTRANEGEDLDLGLGLSLRPGSITCTRREFCKIRTTEDFRPVFSSSPARASVAGVKRSADPFSNDGRSSSPSQVVGWPPIRTYRINSLVNQAKVPSEMATCEKSSVLSNNKLCKSIPSLGFGKSLFVKVKMDGIPIGRKVDIGAHSSYQTLAKALEEMFQRPMNLCLGSGKKQESGDSSFLFDEYSGFVLTYEDRDGDWMLVGDVPWDMFLTTVRRLRIMRTSDANGFGTRLPEGTDEQRNLV